MSAEETWDKLHEACGMADPYAHHFVAAIDAHVRAVVREELAGKAEAPRHIIHRCSVAGCDVAATVGYQVSKTPDAWQRWCEAHDPGRPQPEPTADGAKPPERARFFFDDEGFLIETRSEDGDGMWYVAAAVADADRQRAEQIEGELRLINESTDGWIKTAEEHKKRADDCERDVLQQNKRAAELESRIRQLEAEQASAVERGVMAAWAEVYSMQTSHKDWRPGNVANWLSENASRIAATATGTAAESCVECGHSGQHKMGCRTGTAPQPPADDHGRAAYVAGLEADCTRVNEMNRQHWELREQLHKILGQRMAEDLAAAASRVMGELAAANEARRIQAQEIAALRDGQRAFARRVVEACAADFEHRTLYGPGAALRKYADRIVASVCAASPGSDTRGEDGR